MLYARSRSIRREISTTIMINILLVIASLYGWAGASGGTTNNVLEGLKTGHVYQFEFTSQTRLTNRQQVQSVDEQESSALVFAHFLHGDRESDKRVLVIWADECVNTNCPRTKEGDSSSPALKLFAIWRGPRIVDVLAPGSPDPRKWDVLRSLLFHMQYELETAKIRSVGLCDSKYTAEDPKSRQLIFCRLPEQASLFDKQFDVIASNFTQTTQYFFDAASKLRQLVIREEYEYSTPIFSAANTVLVSQSRLKLVEQSESTFAMGKEEGVNFDAYVEILKKENNLHHLADSVEELFARAAEPEPSPASRTTGGKCAQLGGMEKLKRLDPSPKNVSHALKAVLELEKDLRSVDQGHLAECLEHVQRDREALLAPLLGSLAVAGRRQTQKTVFEFLDKIKGEEEIRRAYLVMLAHNLWPAKVAPEVLTHFEESAESPEKLDELLGLAVGALARRSDDHEIQARLLKTLDHLLSKCDRDSCLVTTLRTFRNFGHPKTGDHVSKYFCHKSVPVAKEALEAMRAVQASGWTTETLHALARVYSNQCPSGKSDSSARTTVTELLLKVKPDSRWTSGVGTILLGPLRDTEFRWKTKREREIYTYSLTKLFDLAEMDDGFKEALEKGIDEITGGDYSRLAPGGLSTAHTGVAADLGAIKALYQLNMEYSRGVTKRSNVDIMLNVQNGPTIPLLSVALTSQDLDQIAPGTSAFADEVGAADSDADGQEVSAGLRLALMDRLQPPVTFFKGQSALMSVLWSMNGEPMTAFEGVFMVNDLRGSIPLTIGHRATVDLRSALWWKMTGAVEVSLWYGNGHTTIATNLAYFATGTITLGQTGTDSSKALLRDETELSAALIVNFETDIEISKAPFQICLQLNQQPLKVKYHNRHSRYDPTKKKKKRSSWKREKLVRVPGQCYITEPKIARQCGDLLTRLARD